MPGSSELSKTKSESEIKKALKVGQYGYSLEAIASGKRGFCYFDSERVNVKAGAAIRKWAEVIVITKVPEPTVIETWGVFPLSYETVEGSGTFEVVGKDTPLPVTMGARSVTYVTVTPTDSGATTLIIAPGNGVKIRVHYIQISNKHSAAAMVSLSFDAGTTNRFNCALAATGGNLNANLTDANWEGGNNEALSAVLEAAYSGGVAFTIGYTLESV